MARRTPYALGALKVITPIRVMGRKDLAAPIVRLTLAALILELVSAIQRTVRLLPIVAVVPTTRHPTTAIAVTLRHDPTALRHAVTLHLVATLLRAAIRRRVPTLLPIAPAAPTAAEALTAEVAAVILVVAVTAEAAIAD